MNEGISRRALLKAAGLSGAGLVLSNFIGPVGALAAEPSKRGFLESPMLTERVAAGKLPPIDERLPEEPFKVGPGVLLQEEFQDWEDGKFGGAFNVASINPTPFTFLGGGGTILRSPGQTTEKSLPNIVSAFSHSDDYTVYKFTIRKGLKWSDGEPVTTEDVRFHFEDVYGDPEVQSPPPNQLYAQGNSKLGMGKLNIVDDLNFELTFSKPYGFLIADLNSWIPNYQLLFNPAHYFKRFHKKYATAEDLAKELKASNQENWVLMLRDKDVQHWEFGTTRALGLPVLLPWVMTDYSEQQTKFERNPYYWHVDSKGQQLPYIDSIINTRSVDRDAQVNATIAGQVDLAVETDAPLNKMPLYVQNAEQGGYRVFTTGSFNWPLQLFLNHDFQYTDPNSAWQKLVSDPEHRFGKAVAAAINSQDINDAVFFGGFGPPFFNTAVHDPDLANKLLDEIGMDKRDADNFRLDPAGNRFVLRMSYVENSLEFSPVAELVKQQLETVGVRFELDPLGIDWPLFNQRKAANDLMATMLWDDGPAWGLGISEDYTPGIAGKGGWSPMTWQYFTTDGKEGRQPPAYMQEFYDLHGGRKAFPPASAEGKAVFDKMLKWMEDNYVTMPLTGLKVVPNIVKKTLHNTQKQGAPFELDSYLSSEGLWLE